MLIHMKAKAKLRKKFLYKKDEKWIAIPKNTEIEVDEESNVALIGEDHVEVDRKDYIVLFPH